MIRAHQKRHQKTQRNERAHIPQKPKRHLGVAHPDLIGKTTEDVRRSLAQLVLAIRRDGEFLYTPDPAEIVRTEDILIVMGPNLSVR